MPPINQNTLISFREVTRDAFPSPFIEVTAGSPRAKKDRSDTVEWSIVNHTTHNIEVAVVDFYAAKGGMPFSSGFVPEPSASVLAKAGEVPGTGTINRIKDIGGVVRARINADGDPATYKYSVLVRIGGVDPWILVRDPEMDIEP